MTADEKDTRLPADLIPADGRFGSGPSKVRPEAVAALAATGTDYLGTSHRRPRVKDVVGQVRDGLAAMYNLPDDYEVLLGNGGATLFWDAASFGLVTARSQHLSFGEFSSKFAKVCAKAPHLGEPDVIESEPGTHPSPKATTDVDVLALTQNETSTGVRAPVVRPDGFADDCLVLVDATSAAGGMEVAAGEFDAYYFSPQKCFGADGGLWLALCSPAAIARIESLAGRWVPPSLDLNLALDNSRKNQTYNTPALATLFLLADTVEWINAHGGLAWAAARCDTSARTLYDWADAHEHALAFVADPAMRSTTVATIDFDDAVDAAALAAALRANGIVDVEPYRKLGRNQLRIALFPAIEPDDVTVLTKAIDALIDRQLDA